MDRYVSIGAEYQRPEGKGRAEMKDFSQRARERAEQTEKENRDTAAAIRRAEEHAKEQDKKSPTTCAGKAIVLASACCLIIRWSLIERATAAAS
jgi:hypothetical protein